MSAPLDGIRVLDLSRVLAGPFATQTLADLGADVIKIERPGRGDDTRHWGPPFAKAGNGSDTDIAAYFLTANRGKRSVTVDMATAQGQAILQTLADNSDIVVENFKTGHLARYGLDAKTLRARNPRLIYCSITGFGQTGPYAAKPGYDFLIQGMAGLMSVTGPEGDNGLPTKSGVPIADLFAGQYATIAILAALNKRNATGAGDVIDIALYDCQVAMLAHQAANYLTTSSPPKRLGNGHANIVPYDAYPASDCHFIIAVGNDTQFAALGTLLGHPEWADDAAFATNPERVRNRDRLTAMIGAITRTNPSSHWLDACARHGVPAGPINSLEAVFRDPQIAAHNLVRTFTRADGGTLPTVATPIAFAMSQIGSERAPPTLGADTHDVLRDELHLSDTAITDLKASGVI